MVKDMLGALMRKIVDLSLEMLKVIYDLVEKLSGEAGQEWLAELKKFLRKENCWTGVKDTVQQAKNIFCLIVGQHKNTEEAVSAGKYDGVSDNINSQNFPMRSRPVGKRIVELIEFDYNPTSKQVLAEAEKRGLERPVYEDAFDFGEQFSEKQRERPIVFLHEPWQGPVGGRRVLVLHGDSSGRHLGLDWFDHGAGGRRVVFAFVRK